MAAQLGPYGQIGPKGPSQGCLTKTLGHLNPVLIVRVPSVPIRPYGPFKTLRLYQDPAGLRDLWSLMGLTAHLGPSGPLGPAVPNRPGEVIKTLRVLGTFGP